ncbi:hypothetical protein [Oligoflexus tunisiensis]|uniref:hypothetical protein n=1 Tax=Oligoflexus tunisiensis TaxID=708132 RepID=UPI00114CA324|nr:hypothetical protein [Oligoflexus tunisiensis]
MKNLIALPLAALLLTHCGKSTDDDATSNLDGDVKGSIPDVGTIIIDLPSAIAPADSSLRLAESDDGIQSFFLIPVTFTGIAGEMTTLTKNVIEHIFGKPVCRDEDTSNDVADCDEYRGIIAGQISETPTIFEIPSESGGDSPSHVKYWANPEGSDYEMGLELYWATGDDAYVSAMQMQLSKISETEGKGTFTFFPTFDGSSEGPDVIVTTFEATEEKKTMDLQLYFTASSDEMPTSLGLTVTDTDGLITGSGTAIRPELAADKGTFAPFQTKEEFAYVYTLAADREANLGVEKFAAVSATGYEDSSSYFTNYGVDSIVKNFAIGLLRTASSTFNCATSGQVISTDLPADICKTNTAVTDADVLAGLTTFCTNNPGNQNICLIAGQANKWANPIYLNADGYVGNESFQKPTDSAYTPLVEALADITVYTPTALKALTKPELPDAVDTVE